MCRIQIQIHNCTNKTKGLLKPLEELNAMALKQFEWLRVKRVMFTNNTHGFNHMKSGKEFYDGLN